MLLGLEHLDPEDLRALQKRASEHGRSLIEEVEQVLIEAASPYRTRRRRDTVRIARLGSVYSGNER